MLQSLHDVVSSEQHNFDFKVRARAEKCKVVLRKIDFWVFLLRLSGCADIYNSGVLSNVCQQVNMLPFERYDHVNKARN